MKWIKHNLAPLAGTFLVGVLAALAVAALMARYTIPYVSAPAVKE